MALRARPAAFVLALLLAAPLPVAAQAPAPGSPRRAVSPQDAACLACHDSPLASRELGDGARLPLFVEQEIFAASVHAAAGCAGCHADLVGRPHPAGRAIPGREAYAAERSRVCTTCHPPGAKGGSGAHAVLVGGAGAPPCSVCHPPHAVLAVAQWRAGTSVTRYCLACHYREMQVALTPGETSVPNAGEAAVWSPVHLTHQCTDCHGGFSKEAHPLRSFASPREHAERLAEGCRGCHPKQYRLAEGSVHAAAAARGDRRAPICTDCHGSHAVQPRAAFEVLSGVPCRRCHPEVFAAFGASVHGAALARPGHASVPLCSDCHHVHAVASLGMREQMSRACRACHPRVEATHARWLPESELHLRSVTCPACHAPAARRRVDLRFLDAARKQEVPEEEIRRILGRDLVPRLDRIEAGDDAVTIWALLRELNRIGAVDGRRFVVQVDAPSGVEAHRLGGREAALKACGACHEEGSRCLEKLCPVP